MSGGRVGVLGASLVIAGAVAVAGAAAGQPGQPGQPGQSGQPGAPGASVTVRATGGAGAAGEAVIVRHSSQGSAGVKVSCTGSSGRVDFGDGTSAPVSSATGPVEHAYPTAEPHQVTLTCGGASVTTVTTGATFRSAAPCIRIRPGAVRDALERMLVRIGIDICRA